MGPGPVFLIELITGARRPRTFVLRVVYTLILMGVIWLYYSAILSKLMLGQASDQPGELTISQMSMFAHLTFSVVVFVQVIAVVFLTPALLAGSIADERRRRRCTTCWRARSPAARSSWASSSPDCCTLPCSSR